MSTHAGTRVQFVTDILLVLLCAALLYVLVEARAHAYRRTIAVDELNGVNLLSEGITLNRGSHISVHRTPKAVVVQILHGEVLLKAREPSSPPLVVRAGNAQIRDFDAVVCVGLDSDRASIDVIDGEAHVAHIDSASHVVNEVTLRAGARAEIAGSGTLASFRLAGSGVGTQQPCLWSIKAGQGSPIS